MGQFSSQVSDKFFGLVWEHEVHNKNHWRLRARAYSSTIIEGSDEPARIRLVDDGFRYSCCLSVCILPRCAESFDATVAFRHWSRRVDKPTESYALNRSVH